MNLGGPPPVPQFQTRVNQSVYGLPFISVMGCAQVQQQLLWVDGFTWSQQGKKTGGKSNSFIYAADVIVGLCNGPILGVADVWSNQSWLGLPQASETYVIAGPSYTYTPTNASTLTNDLGVGIANTYGGTYNDYGAPTSNTLSGTDYSRMSTQSYGHSLATGQYSVNPSNGTYNFSSADNGRTVNILYKYSLINYNQSENDIIPSTQQILVGGGIQFMGDNGVWYASGPNQGNRLTLVSGSGTPGVTGTYTVSGSAPAYYKFASGDIGAEVTITFELQDVTASQHGAPSALDFVINDGYQGQSPYSQLATAYPGAAFGYTNIATAGYFPMNMYTSGTILENRFEVVTPDIMGGGIIDCNPVQCLYQILTNQQWGLGVGPVPFPTACIDNSSAGTWGGAPSTPGTRVADSTAYSWFAANNFFISPVLDSAMSAASTASKWLEAGMCAAYYSEGLLKLAPYGDTTTADNGFTWVAASSYVVALDDTCFLAKEGEDPVNIIRTSAHDAWNKVQIQWDNRINQYSPEITYESDQSMINRWGERLESQQDWNFIHTVEAATFAANMRLKHGLYVRNTYEFSLPYNYVYLEPMDLITISTTSSWAAGLNNANLGLVDHPVRITKIEDDPIKGLKITCEDFPWGAHQPTIYNKQLANANTVVDAYADAGNSEVVMFEATSRLTGYTGNEIWIGANGVGENYGFTNVWASRDGSTYTQIGSIKSPAKMGVVASTFAIGSDPDTINSLVVDLVENSAPIASATSGDADQNTTLCYVGGEIISYSAVTVTGQNQVTMGTYIRRGCMGSSIGSHNAGQLVLVLDSSVFKYEYDPMWAGQTVYFKFQSVNTFGNNPQPLSSLTAVSFVIPGLNPGTIDASSGLVILAGPQNPARPTADPTNQSGWPEGAGPLGWTPAA